MVNAWHTVKGYIAGLIAFVACPCHLPITLPLLIGLTAGTALSAWLASNFAVVAGVFTVVFLGSGILAFRWLNTDPAPSQASSNEGVPRVILLTSSSCSSCQEAREVWNVVGQKNRFKIQVVDISSRHGRELATRHNIFTTPTTLINDRIAFRGVPSRDHAMAALWE